MGTTLAYELRADGLLVLAIQGELDAAGVENVRKRFSAVISHYTGPLIADLSGVEYLSSAGLRLLVSKGNSQRGRGGDLVVVADTPRVLAVLELMEFRRLFSVYETLDAALEGVEQVSQG